MVLQSDVAFVRTGTPLRFEFEFPLGNRLAFGVVSHLDAIHNNRRFRSVQRDFHGVPFRTGLPRTRQRLSQGIKRSGDVVVVFVRFLWLVINLNFVPIMNWHPFFTRLDRNSYEDSGVVVVVTHLENYPDYTIAKLSAGPIKQAHSAMRLYQAIFDGHLSPPDVPPSCQVLAVKELFPLSGICLRTSY